MVGVSCDREHSGVVAYVLIEGRRPASVRVGEISHRSLGLDAKDGFYEIVRGTRPVDGGEGRPASRLIVLVPPQPIPGVFLL